MTQETRIYILDYGAGNVQSVENAIKKLGFQPQYIKSKSDFALADKIVFPGVGQFGAAMQKLHAMGIVDDLVQYIKENRPFMGICVGMQALFEGSAESDHPGLGIIPGRVEKFNSDTKSVPQIGWNQAMPLYNGDLVDGKTRYYFVHSYAVILNERNIVNDWSYTLTTYGNETFVSSISRGNIFATQFHPEKSGSAGLAVFEAFLNASPKEIVGRNPTVVIPKDMLSKRIIACLDVRTNDQGDLVVTKGDQYDVRETTGNVRNLGKPVELAARYYNEGADEITFLNITSFRSVVLEDNLMLQVLRKTSESVFVPLTIGGGIRDIEKPDGTIIPALEVAGEYFRSGADKVSIGSDAVYIAERYLKEQQKFPNTISAISDVYGAQAVVISVDPKRVYVQHPNDTNHFTTKTAKLGPSGEEYCWFQCTVKGGREARDLDVVQLTTSAEALGAGEILLNCMDNDGMNQGYDLDLINLVKKNVKIPVIASSGAGKVEHFSQVFKETGAEAALAAGIFHRHEVEIGQVKEYLKNDFLIRL